MPSSPPTASASSVRSQSERASSLSKDSSRGHKRPAPSTRGSSFGLKAPTTCRQGFCLFCRICMGTDGLSDVYSLEEVARAAGVSRKQARALAGDDRMLPARDALRLGRLLVAERRASVTVPSAPLFARVTGGRTLNLPGLPLAVSGSLHAGTVWVPSLSSGFTPPRRRQSPTSTPSRRISSFSATPGPGGGGGGGGLLEKAPPPKAEKKGHDPIATPVVVVRTPPPAPPPVPTPRVLAAIRCPRLPRRSSARRTTSRSHRRARAGAERTGQPRARHRRWRRDGIGRRPR